MVSRRILLVTVCLLVLIIAAGAYSYVLHLEVSSLRNRVGNLQRENNLLNYRIAMIQARPLNSSTVVHIGYGNNISTQVVDLMEDYGAQTILVNEVPEYAWFNKSLVIIFDAEWIAEKTEDTVLHEFLRNAAPEEAKLVAIGENTSKFFMALDMAGVYELLVTETGHVRNPANMNPPMVGYKWRKATYPSGIEYFGDSILVSGTHNIDDLVQVVTDWD